MVQTAKGLIGIPYRFGGTTPAGFDCSGYVAYVFKKSANVSLPRLATDQIKMGRGIPYARLRPADIVYFWIREKKLWHVGIYIGDYQFIHAPATGGKVNIQNINIRYWKSRYMGGRRVLSKEA